MAQPSIHSDPTTGRSSRQRIDALLDEALEETFPASDSSAIGSGVAVIKQEPPEPRIIDPTNVVNCAHDHV